ncbi:MAG: aspartate--tRNA ligase [Bifidobacteriaceae bacterium]|jgi:aspartyl-tRNA synthetase|nr:aspartate--tRNA ligase [Bifidobacteriaceae bacterium]
MGYRSHLLADLSKADIEKKVIVTGWIDRRRDHGGVAFIDLRDRSGIAQIVIHDEDLARALHNEYIITVEGQVIERPAGQENTNLTTGEIEIVAEDVKIISKSKPLPFQVSTAIEDKEPVGEETRLKYRYLDIRRPRIANSLKLRAKLNKAARKVLDNYDFCEIETPTLVRSTPEGARDFLVPARLKPGAWYALPQSPQLFKQLLMVGGLERYYQIARCYRDEDFRSDRQPEFTQLDIEASFVSQEEIMSLTEKILLEVFACAGYKIKIPFSKITFAEAVDKYGSDKPDLRIDTELVDLTQYFHNTPFRVFQSEYVGAVVYKGGADIPRRQFDAWQEWARSRGAKGLAYVTISANGELGGPVAKNLSDLERNGLQDKTGAQNGDVIFFSAGKPLQAKALLGAARVEIAKRQGLLKDDEFSLVWVVDFPLFKSADEDDEEIKIGNSKWTAMHHAFTMPSDDWADKFESDPANALSQAYDIVCNGHEIGGGSLRVYDKTLQKRIFSVMGIDEVQADEKFGFLLKAFDYGAPPHGGIALGWDRIAAILTKSGSIRDVIAFPKSGGGQDLMTEAPSVISKKQRSETGVDYHAPDKKNK